MAKGYNPVDRMYLRVPVGAMLRRVTIIDETGKSAGQTQDERDAEIGRWARMVAMLMATGLSEPGVDMFLDEVIAFTDCPKFGGRPPKTGARRKTKKGAENGDD